jgi:DNA-binding protein
MPKRAAKPKAAKKAAAKPKRKSKSSKPKETAEGPTRSRIVQAEPAEVVAPVAVVEPPTPSPEVREAPPGPAPPVERVEAPVSEAIQETVVPQPPAPELQVAESPAAPLLPVSLEPALLEGEVEEEPGEGAPEEGLPPRRDVPPNHMFIGKKPVMGYALSAVMQLTQYEEVVLRARGKAISRAVDVAEVVIHRLGNGRFVSRYIKIDTDIVGEGAERRNVSTIEIGVGKRT